ncbi:MULTISPECIES: carbohydrate kinase family protein [Chryseobacterium]|uniref:carbohydrate kinase family protein n=1 Tax=Chryseobacterium TaxID=59732 RepID=UPI00195ADCC2|nr:MULTISPECIES: carbohydrate kinase [Chryseobacterium]MBM7420256.1 fructokinase [Chryseobacterium sp. JUb44]MDH6210200.1 fructokinase [Chryseobacterium sp. BIGb0186]WSO08917.1 carbohydrate kinase [Chryseobacterium scophthalmum]
MFKNTNLKIVSFGEILFDVFGTEKKVGGAPLNLALRTRSFGFPTTMISAIGNDMNGQELKKYIAENDVNIDTLITNPDHETGVVQVYLNERGSATYDIKFPSAWDFIEITMDIRKSVWQADIFFFGSLICRNAVSKNTLFELLESNPEMYKVFDVNLRAPHYNIDLLKPLMNVSDFIKFNDEEILEIASELGFQSDNLEENIRFIAQNTVTKSICVTRGKHGSILLWDDVFYYHGGFVVEVVDTVGAGDSFLAALIAKLMSDKAPQNALDFASAVGAIVASRSGANPEITTAEIDNYLKKDHSTS